MSGGRGLRAGSETRPIVHLREQQAVDRLLGVDVVDEPRLALLLERAHLVLLGEREQRDGALVADERRVARVKVLEEELELADRLAHERHRRARDHRVGRVEEPAEDRRVQREHAAVSAARSAAVEGEGDVLEEWVGAEGAERRVHHRWRC